MTKSGPKFKKSWALMDVRDHNKLVKMLEDTISRSSADVIKGAEEELLDDTRAR